MFGARSFAMAVNRLVDAAIDARNPRTAGRELPAGRLRRAPGDRVRAGLAARLRRRRLAARADHALARAARDRPDGHLSVPQALHAALPPLAGRRRRPRARSAAGSPSPGTSTSPPGCSARRSRCWIAGFDVIYATMDIEVDRAQGLHSHPGRLRHRPRAPGLARAARAERGRARRRGPVARPRARLRDRRRRPSRCCWPTSSNSSRRTTSRASTWRS